MAFYAAYASNLDADQMRERCPHSPVVNTGWLEGWRLTFGGEDIGWEGALATLAEERGSRVFVSLYDLTREDERALDEIELVTVGLYAKITARVQTLDGDQLAWTYVLNHYEGGVPSARYLGLVADAAEKAGAPADYVAELRTRPCRSIGD
ncbi:MAG: gamma-glutamylcyclotransferase [Mycobacteriales bacterium]|nr:gamma-glutamylcyclotransferase [Frankia sp.]